MLEVRIETGQVANERFTLIYSCLDLQAATHSCGPVMVMELPALLSLPESGISHSRCFLIKTADVHFKKKKKKGILKYQLIDKQASIAHKMHLLLLMCLTSLVDQNLKET